LSELLVLQMAAAFRYIQWNIAWGPVMRMQVRIAVIAAFIALCVAQIAHAAETVTVFAAASLTDALTAIGKQYQANTGTDVKFSFAASSQLARQIEAGNQADMFISADTDWMDYLQDRSLIQAATRKNILGNRLVLIAPKDSRIELTIAPGFPLAKALGNGRLSIADPDSVPAGRYGRQSLVSLGVWNSVSGKLARADNVRFALAFVSRGEAPLGIVYETDAKSDPSVKTVGAFPEDSHLPIVYPIALTAGAAAPKAKDFLAAVEGPKAAQVFEQYGFTVLH